MMLKLAIPEDLQPTAEALRRLVQTLEERRHRMEGNENVRLPIHAALPLRRLRLGRQPLVRAAAGAARTQAAPDGTRQPAHAARTGQRPAGPRAPSRQLVPSICMSPATTGRLLAARQLTLVYGGGKVGLMGAVADAALAAGGRVVGVIPQMLLDREVGHSGLSELHVVTTLSERKLLMGELSDAFLTLAGRHRHPGRAVRGLELDAAGPATQALRAAQSRRLLRRADPVPGPRGGRRLPAAPASGGTAGGHRGRAVARSAAGRAEPSSARNRPSTHP